MKVKCINRGWSRYLTVGETYDVVEATTEGYYRVAVEIGRIIYPKTLFEIVEDIQSGDILEGRGVAQWKGAIAGGWVVVMKPGDFKKIEEPPKIGDWVVRDDFESLDFPTDGLIEAVVRDHYVFSRCRHHRTKQPVYWPMAVSFYTIDRYIKA